jgi:hypothetical protein
MHDEQERHEQLMYRLDTIERHILRLDTRSINAAQQLASTERNIKEIYDLVFVMLPTAAVCGGVVYGLYRWLGDQVANLVIWFVVGGFVGFLIVRSLWRKFRMWWRVQMAAPEAFEFKVGDRLSVWRNQDRFGVSPGSKGTVIENGSRGIAVKWDNGTFGDYYSVEVYNFDKLAQRSQEEDGEAPHRPNRWEAGSPLT